MNKRKVLFVDDDPRVTSALKRQMRNEAFEVLQATSGQQALEMLAEHEVDVLVTDERMPGMSGSELATAVRNEFPETVRIMLTGQATLEAAAKAINEGEIFRFYIKPCNPADLVVGIRQGLVLKELMAENQQLRQRVRSQATVLSRLEKSNPGITKLEVDDDGAVLIEETDTERVLS